MRGQGGGAAPGDVRPRAAGTSFSFEEWLDADTSTEYVFQGCGAVGDPEDAQATFLAQRLFDDVSRSVSAIDAAVVAPALVAFGPERDASGAALGRS